jgi:hypothetical protein
MRSGLLYFSQGGNLPYSTSDLARSTTDYSVHQLDHPFLWNAYILQSLKRIPGSACVISLLLNTICGYVGQRQIAPGVHLTLISRMARQRAGTRFTRRGVDATGAAAVTVETEMSVNTNDRIVTWTVLRGSVPLPWRQVMQNLGGRPVVELLIMPPPPSPSSPQHLYTDSTVTLPTEHIVTKQINAISFPAIQTSTPTSPFSTETMLAFHNHITWLQMRYGSSIALVSLLNERHRGEATLAHAYSHMVHLVGRPEIEHLSVPILRQCGSLRMAAERVCVYAKRHGLTIASRSKNRLEIYQRQQGCLRVNCMDCLDRTGLLQFRVAMLMLPSLLRACAVTSVSEQHALLALRALWADNNDAIAQQYTGTGTIAGWLVRYGGRCHVLRRLADTRIMLTRAYLNTLVDPRRQWSLDVFQGREVDVSSSITSAPPPPVCKKSNSATSTRIYQYLLRAQRAWGPTHVSNLHHFILVLFWIALFVLYLRLHSSPRTR